MTPVAVWLACMLLAGLAGLQVSLVAGAPLGQFAWGGQHRVLTANLRLGSIVAIALYAVFVVIILQRAGAIAIVPPVVCDVGIWVIAGYLALGIPLNMVSRSRPERFTMTPTVAILFALVLIVAMGW